MCWHNVDTISYSKGHQWFSAKKPYREVMALSVGDEMLPKDWRSQLHAVYPKRRGQGWVKAGQQIEKHLKDGESFDDMLRGADNYRKHCAVTGEFVRMAQTFFGPNMWWLEFLDDEPLTNEITLDDEAGELGITRQEGESDESLKRRIGIAQTMKAYNMQ